MTLTGTKICVFRQSDITTLGSEFKLVSSTFIMTRNISYKRVFVLEDLGRPGARIGQLGAEAQHSSVLVAQSAPFFAHCSPFYLALLLDRSAPIVGQTKFTGISTDGMFPIPTVSDFPIPTASSRQSLGIAPIGIYAGWVTLLDDANEDSRPPSESRFKYTGRAYISKSLAL